MDIMLVEWFMILSLFCSLLTGVYGVRIKSDHFKDVCPLHAEVAYLSLRQIETSSLLECLVLCQRDDLCSSVDFHQKQCDMFIGNEVDCSDRSVPRTAGHKYLEKVSSNWCSNGGQMTVDESGEEECVCSSGQYTGTFCQIGICNEKRK